MKSASKASFMLFATLVLSESYASENTQHPGTTIQAMEKGNIIPDVISVAPPAIIEVSYPSGAKVNLGNELTPTEVKDVPEVAWQTEPGALYTLLLTDPDAPSRQDPKFREVRHWLVVNVPGNKVSEGQTVYEYIGSGPPKGTGLHRYVFLVFKQQNRIETSEHVTNRSRDGRLQTSTRKLMTEFNLGDPVAGNYYQAQFDDYVTILQAQLGGAPPSKN